MEPHLKNAKANVRESAITVLLNYSIIMLQRNEDAGAKLQILKALGCLKGEAEA